jgi:hypothetical protein
LRPALTLQAMAQADTSPLHQEIDRIVSSFFRHQAS